MYGLPEDIDLSFFIGATLIQICIGENEVIANLHPNISIMVASSGRLSPADEIETATLDDPRGLGVALLAQLGAKVQDAQGTTDGTLSLRWDTGVTLDIFDSWREFESYTVRHGDNTIVV